MINNSFTKKIAEALARNKSGSSFDRSIMHVEREWYTLVGLAILLLATGALWSVYAYRTYSDFSMTEEISAEDTSVYRGETVNAALKYREERIHEYEKLRGDLPGVSPELKDEEVPEVSTTTDSIPEAVIENATEEPTEADVGDVVIEETQAEAAI